MSGPKKEQFTSSEGLTPGETEVIEINFRAHSLDTDVGNALVPASMMAEAGNFDTINPFQTYEEYLRDKAAAYANPGAYYNAIMKRSDSALVEEYNARIRAFNEELQEIKRNRDAKKIKEFVQEMITFLNTEN